MRTTYSGHTLACAAGVAAMKYYREHDIQGHVAEMHEIVAPFMDEMVESINVLVKQDVSVCSVHLK